MPVGRRRQFHPPRIPSHYSLYFSGPWRTRRWEHPSYQCTKQIISLPSISRGYCAKHLGCLWDQSSTVEKTNKRSQSSHGVYMVETCLILYRALISVSQTTTYTLKLSTAILSNGLVAAWKWKSHSTIGPNPRDPHQDSRWGRSAPCNQEVRSGARRSYPFFTLFVFTLYLTFFLLSGLWLIILGSMRACEHIITGARIWRADILPSQIHPHPTKDAYDCWGLQRFAWTWVRKAVTDRGEYRALY